MAAQMKITKWHVEPARKGDVEVFIEGGVDDRYAVIIHAGDCVWIDGEDIHALVDALQAAANALKGA